MTEYQIIKLFWVSWFICGFFGYGFSFACFQRRYPTIAKDKYWEDFFFSLFIFIVGPAGLFAVFMDKGYNYGFKIK